MLLDDGGTTLVPRQCSCAEGGPVECRVPLRRGVPFPLCVRLSLVSCVRVCVCVFTVRRLRDRFCLRGYRFFVFL